MAKKKARVLKKEAEEVNAREAKTDAVVDLLRKQTPKVDYEIEVRPDIAAAIKEKDWPLVFKLKGKPVPVVREKVRNDYGAIGAVVTWDDPCRRCGTKAFLNTTSGLGCLGCGLQQ
jgi:hypothetical protein